MAKISPKTKLDEIIRAAEREMNGDAAHDLAVLRAHAGRPDPNTQEGFEILSGLGRYVLEKFPQEALGALPRQDADATFAAFAALTDARKKMSEGKAGEALEVLEKISAGGGNGVTQDGAGERTVSFNAPFEEMIYRQRTHSDTRPIRIIPPLTESIHFHRARALFDLKRYDEAERVLQSECLRLNPVDVEAMFELAQIYKVRSDVAGLRKILSGAYPCIFSRAQLARFYREHTFAAMRDEALHLAVCLTYISIDYADSPVARANLNSLAKMGANLARPSADAVKAALSAADIPVGPCPDVYQLALSVARTIKPVNPGAAKYAYSIAYDLTHYRPLLAELG